MNAYSGINHSRIAVPASVWAASLWLRVALAGAMVAALGVAGLLRQDASATVSVVTLVAGLVLGAIGYRRMHAAMDATSNPPADGVRSAPVAHHARTPNPTAV